MPFALILMSHAFDVAGLISRPRRLRGAARKRGRVGSFGALCACERGRVTRQPRGGAWAMLRCGMSLDVVDLRSFYGHPLGKVARRFVSVGIHRIWTGSKGLRILGIGYSTPYLGLFREEAERCLAFMPATQGVMKWPSQRPTLAALVDEAEWPLPDAA